MRISYRMVVCIAQSRVAGVLALRGEAYQVRSLQPLPRGEVYPSPTPAHPDKESAIHTAHPQGIAQPVQDATAHPPPTARALLKSAAPPFCLLCQQRCRSCWLSARSNLLRRCLALKLLFLIKVLRDQQESCTGLCAVHTKYPATSYRGIAQSSD